MEQSNNVLNMITLLDDVIKVDNWIPNPEDRIFKQVNKAIILPVREYYGRGEEWDNLNYFMLAPKRCYNSDEMRNHTTHYLNYFLKFYDTDMELLAVYYQIKILIDLSPEYDKVNFLNDLTRYIFHNPSILNKIYRMNEDNYEIILEKRGRSVESLQYTTEHGKILMQMSFLINTIIPLATHFAFVKGVDHIDIFLLEIYDIIFQLSHVDIYNKLYETALNATKKNRKGNSLLWDKQDIRGINITTHTRSSVENIILNLMPKYVYEKNVVNLNHVSMRKNNGFKITDISYEYDFRPICASNRDDDFISDFDKFEANMIRQDEALYLQNKVACKKTMDEIRRKYGPFYREEIDLYTEVLSEDGLHVINKFQQELIFNLFYKSFGDPASIYAINTDDYVTLMIAAKRILLSHNMIILPYIIGSKINRIAERKRVNKKEFMLIKESPYWEMIVNKYKNPKIEEQILGLTATILSSEFRIIDYYDEELNGRIIENIPDIICEEILLYITMI